MGIQRFNVDQTNSVEIGQFIKTVAATGTPESVYPGVKQVFTIQAVADVASSLAGTYFDIYDQGSIVRVGITVDGVGAFPPSVSFGRLLAVDINAGDTASAVALAVKTVIDADANFVASVLTDTVTVTQAIKGVRSLPVAGTSGFTMTLSTAGTDIKKLVPSVSFIARKGRATPNVGLVYLGNSSANDAQLIEMATGDIVSMYAPPGGTLDLGKFYVDVATTNDGVIVCYPAIMRDLAGA